MRIKVRVFHPEDHHLPDDQQRMLYSTVLQMPYIMKAKEYWKAVAQHLKGQKELLDFDHDMIVLLPSFQAYPVDESYVHNHEHEAVDDHDREHIIPHETIGV